MYSDVFCHDSPLYCVVVDFVRLHLFRNILPTLTWCQSNELVLTNPAPLNRVFIEKEMASTNLPVPDIMNCAEGDAATNREFSKSNGRTTALQQD